MITVNNIAMNYGAKLLFTDVNLNLNAGDRYALVGANGAGKSTFLKLLLQEEIPTLGEITIFKNARIGSLKQDQFRYEDTNIIDCVIAGKEVLWNALQEKTQLIERDIWDDESGMRLGELEHIIMDNDGYVAEIFAEELLIGLGIKKEFHDQPLSVLSGGYKLRVLLAQALFNNPDILLLDEPTNHLDIISIYWLEGYLKEKFKGVLVFISHDITFLNNVSTHTLDVDYGEIRQYTGNYDSFVKQKQDIIEQKLHEKSSAEKKIAQLQAVVDKFRAGTRASQAKSKAKQIDRIEMPDIHKSSRVHPHFVFNKKRPSGKNVLKVDEIFKNYDEKRVLSKVKFNVNRGDKIIIIGPNGVGKSTLLKILLDKIKSDHGSYEWGYETHIGYFAQDHHELLHESISVLEWLTLQAPEETDNTIRSALGKVLFKQDETAKNILTLSGGEGARLLIAKIMLDYGNVLVLDEPTNHLDIESKESLRDALIKYPGTVLLVSHDRDFASNIANRVIAMSEKGVVDFRGSYKEYLEKHGKDYLSSQWVLSSS